MECPMNNKNLSIRLVGLALGCVLVAGSFLDTTAQNLRWIRVGRAQTFFMDYGNECELVPFTTNDFLTWPAQYGDNQYTTRAKGVWMGATGFQDPVEGKLKSYKVIGVGPRYDPANVPLMVFSNTIKMIAREKPPTIYVDLANGTSNTLYDIPDEINLSAAHN